MSVVLPYDKIEEEWAPTVVLCGDVHQRELELVLSALEQLYEMAFCDLHMRRADKYSRSDYSISAGKGWRVGRVATSASL